MFFASRLNFSGALERVKRAPAEHHGWVNLPIPENLVITWPYTDRTNGRPSAPQENQCLLLHFLASLGAQEKTDCTSMWWSIDSCQDRVAADQYHLTVSGAQLSTHRRRVFFDAICWQVTCFQMIAGSSLVFFLNSWDVLLMSLWPPPLAFDFKPTWDAKIQPVI